MVVSPSVATSNGHSLAESAVAAAEISGVDSELAAPSAGSETEVIHANAGAETAETATAKLTTGGSQHPLGSANSFSALWEAWQVAACSLLSLSRVSVYPSLDLHFDPFFLYGPQGKQLEECSKDDHKGPFLPPALEAAGQLEYPPAKAVISYRSFKEARALCPDVFSSCFSASVFSQFLRDAHGDVSTQTVARSLLNSAFNAHIREKFSAFVNAREEFTVQTLAQAFEDWSSDPTFEALHAVKLETEEAHPGLLEFFTRYLATRLFFCLDVGKRGFVSSSELLNFSEFQLLLDSLYKPIESPLGETPPQWSVQFAYDIFNFLRENKYKITEDVVEELLEALRQVVCTYTYDVTREIIRRLFVAKAAAAAAEPDGAAEANGTEAGKDSAPDAGGAAAAGPGQCQMRWGSWRSKTTPSGVKDGVADETAKIAVSLDVEELIRFLAALQYAAAVWSPSSDKAFVADPVCVRATLKYLWSLLDVKNRGFLDTEALTDLWIPVSDALAVRGFPVSCLMENSVQHELIDRCGARHGILTKDMFLRAQTHSRVLAMFSISPAFFQLFDQREHCPGAPLLAGDPLVGAPEFLDGAGMAQS